MLVLTVFLSFLHLSRGSGEPECVLKGVTIYIYKYATYRLAYIGPASPQHTHELLGTRCRWILGGVVQCVSIEEAMFYMYVINTVLL